MAWALFSWRLVGIGRLIRYQASLDLLCSQPSYERSLTGVLCGDGCLVPAPSQHAQPEERAPAGSQFPRP